MPRTNENIPIYPIVIVRLLILTTLDQKEYTGERKIFNFFLNNLFQTYRQGSCKDQKTD